MQHIDITIFQKLPTKCQLLTGAGRPATFMTDSKRCAVETQEQAKAQSAEADACQLAAHMMVSNAVNKAILHDQVASSRAAEADACQVAAMLMVGSAFSKAIHEDQVTTFQQVRMMVWS